MKLALIRILQQISACSLLILCSYVPGWCQHHDTIAYVQSFDSTRLFVKVAGNGPICIFVHGGPGAWSKSFEALGGQELEKSLTMVYYDQRGCGRSSDAPQGDYSPAAMLADIEAIRQFMKADKVFLLSHSFGGIIATQYAAQNQNHLQGLILANSTLDLSASLQHQINYMQNQLQIQATTVPYDSIWPVFIRVQKAFGTKGLAYKRLSDNPNTVAQVDSIDHLNNSSYTFANKWRTYGASYMKSYISLTKKIYIPVLVITGEKDHAIGPNHYRSFQFPDKQVVQINGGHILYYEQNDTFVKAIKAFIDKVK